MTKIAEWVAGAGRETFRLVGGEGALEPDESRTESGLYVLERMSLDSLGAERWDRAGSFYRGRRGSSECNLILCEGIAHLARWIRP